jgi:hypothetical protein
MLDCLRNQIGISGVCEPTPPSGGGYYIQSLTGMSVINADKIMDSKYQSGFSLLQEKIDFATRQLEADFLIEMQKKATTFEPMSLSFSDYLVYGNTTNAPINGWLAGKRLKILDTPYKSVRIDKISSYCDFTGSKSIFIYDLNQNKLLDTITVDSVANQIVETIVNKTYSAGYRTTNIAVLWDISTMTTYQLSNIGGISTNIYLPSATPKFDQNLQYPGLGYGLGINYSIECNLSPIMCSNATSLGLALLYLAGSMISKEARFSIRLNDVIMSRGKDWEQLEADYLAEYEMRLKAIVNGVRLPCGDDCFKCRRRVGYKVRVP